MSFLSEIRGFRQNRLKKTETTVRNCDGEVYTEELDPSTGTYKAAKVGQESFGWVGDVKLDLQLAEACSNLYFGSQDVANDLDLLRENRITHILNLAPAVENIFPSNFIYLKIQILDLPETDIKTYFETTNDFITDSLSGGGRTYVHCNAGCSRAPTIVAAHLMKTKGLSASSALQTLKNVRPSVSPNKGFMDCLKAYEQECSGTFTS